MRLAFTGIHSASAWGVQDTGGRGCCPCRLGSPAGRTAVERSFPRVTRVTYFHAIKLEPWFFVGEELEGSNLNGAYQSPWKPINRKALKLPIHWGLLDAMGYPDKPQAGAAVTRDGTPSLCVQVPVRLSPSRISPVARRITLLTHRHGCKDLLANSWSSFCTRRQHCLKVFMKFSLWTYGDKGVMPVPKKKSWTPGTSE